MEEFKTHIKEENSMLLAQREETIARLENAYNTTKKALNEITGALVLLIGPIIELDPHKTHGNGD